MNERVNIAYSVPIDTLSEEVARLIENVYHSMEDVLTSMQGFKVPLSIETHNHIDSTRHQLAAVDASLSDINNIVSAYLNYKVSTMASEHPIEQPPIPIEGTENLADTFGTLQEKLALFKETLPAPESMQENEESD